MRNAILAIRRSGSIDGLALFLTRFVAEHWDRAVVASESFPASTCPAKAHALSTAAVGTARKFTVRPTATRAAVAVATVIAGVADVAGAPAVQAEAVTSTIVLARVQLHVQSRLFAASTTEAIITEALPWIVRRGEAALAMPAAIVFALWILTVWPSPARLALAGAIHARAVFGAVRRANLVCAGLHKLGAALEQAPAIAACAPASFANAMAKAVPRAVKEARTVLHLARGTSEHWVAVAFGVLRVARAMSGAEATLSADLSRGTALFGKASHARRGTSRP